MHNRDVSKLWFLSYASNLNNMHFSFDSISARRQYQKQPRTMIWSKHHIPNLMFLDKPQFVIKTTLAMVLTFPQTWNFSKNKIKLLIINKRSVCVGGGDTFQSVVAEPHFFYWITISLCIVCIFSCVHFCLHCIICVQLHCLVRHLLRICRKIAGEFLHDVIVGVKYHTEDKLI